MSLVESNAQPSAMTEDEARAVTNRIRQMVSIAWVEVVKAYQGRAWAVLGYESWDAYCDAEFDTRIRLPREERREVVASLAEQGLSTRAIAAVTGVSKDTVQRDLSGVSHETPAPAPSGGEFSPTEPTPADPDQEVVDAEIVEEQPVRTVTGTDGKTYPASRPNGENRHIPAIRDYAKLGLAAGEIAAELGIGVSRVSHLAQQHGIVLKGSSAWVQQRWEKIAEMAAAGWSSAQIAEQLDMNPQGLRSKARERGIEFPADKVLGRQQKIDPERIVNETIIALEGLVMGLQMIDDIASFDAEKRLLWSEAFEQPLRVLNRFKKELSR